MTDHHTETERTLESIVADLREDLRIGTDPDSAESYRSCIREHANELLAWADADEADDDDDARENCPDCNGTGRRQIPLMNDWDEVEGWTERRCSFCGGSGSFDAMQAAEMKAEMGAAGWFDWGSE